jgi:sec-independent protein translocase protein TatB
VFDLDVSKILIVGMVALVVVGPKDLPRVLRVAGQVVGKMRRVRNEVQSQLKELMKEADLEGAKKEFEAIDRAAYVSMAVDPKTAMRGHLRGAANGSEASPPARDGAAAKAEETYASPEMRAYLDPSPATELPADAPPTAEATTLAVADAETTQTIDRPAANST